MEYYVPVKWVHVAAVLASGSLFLVRGVLGLAGVRWTMAAPLRFTSYAIDTVLLSAAVLLAAMLRQYPFVHGWLTAKVLLLALYIVLGSYALKRGRTRRVRAACLAAAVLVYASMLSIALAHSPWGFLQPWLPGIH